MKRQVDELKGTVAAICRAGGIPDGDAEMIADVLVTTDMRGIHSHGVVRLARYLDCIRAGGIKPTAEPVVLSESANSIMASADGGLGIPVRNAAGTADRRHRFLQFSNLSLHCISLSFDGAHYTKTSVFVR